VTETTAKVAVFGPHPLLGITIERLGDGNADDVHLHSAGQGVWVARMAGEMLAHPILCAFHGGESGRLLRPLLDELPGEVRYVDTATANGCYVIDRRSGEREMIAHHWSQPPSRHEMDDLFSVSCAAALEASVLVVCGPVPVDALPLEVFRNLVANAEANGTKAIVDLSPPRLNSALEGGPEVVKLNDWQLAEFLEDEVADPDKLRRGAERVLEAGARSVLVTRGGDPALVLRGDAAWTLTPPRFEGGAPEGSGDSMVGALSAALARGMEWEEALRLSAAAGAANFLRHGLGSGSRDIVLDLLDRVDLKPA
jgi:1-phosphofructokinase